MSSAELNLTQLIAQAPWREAVTYRETWPHQYVLLLKDRQAELVKAVCARICAGEGLVGRFFRITPTYLFIADHKYWFMSPCAAMDFDADADNPDPASEIVLNRAPLYRDRRDFIIQDGDTGRRADYPVNRPYQSPPQPQPQSAKE